MNEHKTRLVKNSIIILILLGILVFFMGLVLFIGSIQPRNKISEISNVVYFKIGKGTGISEIAGDLYADDIIKSKFAFEFYSYISGKGSSFKPGTYELSSNQSVPEIASIITSGPRKISATIIPGMTLKEADDYLSALRIINQNELSGFDVNSEKGKYSFLKNAKSLEGFVFPDTYQFFAGSDVKTVVEKILDNFGSKIAPYLANLQDPAGNGNMNWLITASILEKEVISEGDLRMVVGVFQNRISKNMPLQVDATVIYAKCQGRFLDCPPLNSEDFKIDSPYNTYKYKGLPVGPISNPGLVAIKAALDPEPNNYLFYLSDPNTKRTIFSQTLQEHSRNRSKYLSN